MLSVASLSDAQSSFSQWCLKQLPQCCLEYLLLVLLKVVSLSVAQSSISQCCLEQHLLVLLRVASLRGRVEQSNLPQSQSRVLLSQSRVEQLRQTLVQTCTSDFCRWVPAGLAQSCGIGRRARPTTREVELPTRGSTSWLAGLGQRPALTASERRAIQSRRPAELNTTAHKRSCFEEMSFTLRLLHRVLSSFGKVAQRADMYFHHIYKKMTEMSKGHLISQRLSGISLEIPLYQLTLVVAPSRLSAVDS